MEGVQGQANMMQLAQVKAMQDQFMKLQQSCEKYVFFVRNFDAVFLEGFKLLYKIRPLNDFYVRRCSYHLKA